MDNAYFHWLIDLLGDEYLSKNYLKLLSALFQKVFTWSIDWDENRANDGIGLRRIFAKEHHIFDENDRFWPFSGCSVLEMMVAIARRCDDELIYNPEKGDQTGIIFWVMIQNLGLDIYDDFGFFEDEVDDILNRFLERKYDSDGNGNLFILHRSDPRKIDLWLQLNLYLREHFYEYWAM